MVFLNDKLLFDFNAIQTNTYGTLRKVTFVVTFVCVCKYSTSHQHCHNQTDIHAWTDQYEVISFFNECQSDRQPHPKWGIIWPSTDLCKLLGSFRPLRNGHNLFFIALILSRHQGALGQRSQYSCSSTAVQIPTHRDLFFSSVNYLKIGIWR